MSGPGESSAPECGHRGLRSQAEARSYYRAAVTYRVAYGHLKV